MKNSKVLIIGATVIDYIVNIPQLPKTGEDCCGEMSLKSVGGSAYNVQRVLSQFNCPHDFMTPIGMGEYADTIKKDFKTKEIPIFLQIFDADNGWNLSIVEEDGERTFISFPGIETDWQTVWFNPIDWSRYHTVFLSGYELEGPSGPVIIQALTEARKQHQFEIVFDASPRVSAIDGAVLGELFKLRPIVHCNEAECQVLSSKWHR